MRILSIGLIIGALCAGMSAAQAPSQPNLRGPGGAIGGFHLLTMPAIQRELQMDDTQITRAREMAGRMNSRFQQDMGKMKGLNRDEQMKRAPTLAGPHYEEGMKQLRAFLKPAQIDRFDQILFQQRGPMAMLEPKIAKSLQINNEQAQKVAELVAQAENEQQGVVKAAGKQSNATAIKVEAIAAAANEKAIEILSPEQQRTWLKIVGQPFRPDLGGDAKGGETGAPKGAEK